MQKCIYTTNHKNFLAYMLANCPHAHCPPDETPPTSLACFRSNREWVTAKALLRKEPDESGTLPILIREIKDDSELILPIEFLAELVEVKFASEFATDSERKKKWLEDKFWLQERVYEGKGPSDDWDAEREIAYSLENGKTYYIIRNLRKIEPLPLVELKKVLGGTPLSPEYSRSYSICEYPDKKIVYKA
jgi:hypothetical protein